jgi:hypothetical protein
MSFTSAKIHMANSWFITPRIVLGENQHLSFVVYSTPLSVRRVCGLRGLES